ncbi:hypothetical protein [Agromyces salentinus]|uniref:Uncharacterized protein n=1 Tax=Agromyces salentinus TaxID=269421 RepID=A0ABN2MW07_9MICO|nr:hypothetical protein [Agromyces salentinus]
MTILLLLLVLALVAWAAVGSFTVAVRDGYHRLGLRDDWQRTPASID